MNQPFFMVASIAEPLSLLWFGDIAVYLIFRQRAATNTWILLLENAIVTLLVTWICAAYGLSCRNTRGDLLLPLLVAKVGISTLSLALYLRVHQGRRLLATYQAAFTHAVCISSRATAAVLVLTTLDGIVYSGGGLIFAGYLILVACDTVVFLVYRSGWHGSPTSIPLENLAVIPVALVLTYAAPTADTYPWVIALCAFIARFATACASLWIQCGMLCQLERRFLAFIFLRSLTCAIALSSYMDFL